MSGINDAHGLTAKAKENIYIREPDRLTCSEILGVFEVLFIHRALDVFRSESRGTFRYIENGEPVSLPESYRRLKSTPYQEIYGFAKRQFLMFSHAPDEFN